MYRTDFSDVRDFHKKFELPYDHINAVVGPLRAEILEFRVGFLNEECAEFDEAYGEKDLVKVVDALLDFVYVSIGTMLFMAASPDRIKNDWPTFTSVLRKSQEIPELLRCKPPVPTLLPASIHLMMRDRISCEVKAFKASHYAAVIDNYPIDLAICCLANATEAAYLTAYLMGVPWTNCWVHVQAANMSKVRAQRDGSDSKRQSSWDVVKPTGFVPPNEYIASELLGAGAEL